MSSVKRKSEPDWDREKGRRTVYFSRDEVASLKRVAGKEGLEESALLKSIYRRYLSGQLVSVEELDAYKRVIDKLIASGKTSPDLPVYGKAPALKPDEKT